MDRDRFGDGLAEGRKIGDTQDGGSGGGYGPQRTESAAGMAGALDPPASRLRLMERIAQSYNVGVHLLQSIAAILAKQQVLLDGCRTWLLEPLEGILLKQIVLDMLAPTSLDRCFHPGRSLQVTVTTEVFPCRVNSSQASGMA